MTYGPRNTPPKTFPVDKAVIHANLLKSSSEAIEALRRLRRNREAIPWCTTHNRDAYVTTGGCGDVRYSDECYEDTTRCVVSTGGPDHKWWKTT